MKATLLVLAFAIQAAQEPGPWRIEFDQDGKLHSTKDDGTDRRAEKLAQWRGLSPDGTRQVFTREYDGDFEIWVSDADGKNSKKLTDNRALDMSPVWTPDGRRIVFYSNREVTMQIWVMDSDGANAKRLTNHPLGAVNPRVSKGGIVAYQEILPRDREKLPPATLRTLDLSGGDSKVVLAETQMLGYEWSPSGDRLAVSLIQEIRIVEPSGKSVMSFDLSKVHKEMYSHAAFAMIWRPDGGALACRIVFLGGRMEGAKIFGDDQLFILPIDGKPIVIETKGPASPVRWKRR